MTPLLAAADPVHLIAHRGGVVDDQHPENSLASLEAAIARGYWMIEVDIRRTKDGRAILQHDPTFQRYYGDPRPVAELTWAEVSRLRAEPGGRSPLAFEELCERCAGRIRLMLDIKVNDQPPGFHEGLAATLARHGLLETAYVLSSGGADAFWRTRCRTMRGTDAIRTALAAGDPVARTGALFEIAGRLTEPAVRLAQEHGIPVVAAINTFRYRMAGVDDQEGAAADAARLLTLGVRHFQIDSIYERHFRR
ncbi:MAG TPA: glycerophosphodiester phosphodiesterase family protein [Vicinamibacterales bacterium]